MGATDAFDQLNPRQREAACAAKLRHLSSGQRRAVGDDPCGVREIPQRRRLDARPIANRLQRTLVKPNLKRVEATDAWAIVVDLSGLTFISSTGVRLLVAFRGVRRVSTRRDHLRRRRPGHSLVSPAVRGRTPMPDRKKPPEVEALATRAGPLSGV